MQILFHRETSPVSDMTIGSYATPDPPFAALDRQHTVCDDDVGIQHCKCAFVLIQRRLTRS
jgi:hypothetical protein